MTPDLAPRTHDLLSRDESHILAEWLRRPRRSWARRAGVRIRPTLAVSA